VQEIMLHMGKSHHVLQPVASSIAWNVQ